MMRARVYGLPTHIPAVRIYVRDLPQVEIVPTAVRSAILDGKDVNLAVLLIPNFDLGEYSRYANESQCLRPLPTSDPRLNRNLTPPRSSLPLTNTKILCVKYGTGEKS